MPIKIPKGFTRRKSSTNALEEVPNPPEPSFRVFERAPGGSKSFDGGNTLKRMSQARPLSAGQHVVKDGVSTNEDSNLSPSNRGSGGTDHSSSSGGLNDNSSSSARYSSSSTLPSNSSTEAPFDENFGNPKTPRKIPIPPIPPAQPAFSLRAGGRTFSFGRKPVPPPQSSTSPVSKSSPAVPRTEYSQSPLQEPEIYNRPRALTESSHASASTATPPKLLDTDLDFGYSDHDGFGSMFDGFGEPSSKRPESQFLNAGRTASPEHTDEGAFSDPQHALLAKRSPFTPPPLFHTERFQEPLSSPYSVGSHDSRDALMASSSPLHEPSHFRFEQRPPVPRHRQSLYEASNSVSGSPATISRAEQTESGPGSALRRSSAYANRRDSTPLRDEDAKVVMNSVSASRRPKHESIGLEERSENSQHSPVQLRDGEVPDLNNRAAWAQGSTETTPRATKQRLANAEDSLFFDTTLHGRSGSSYLHGDGGQARQLSPSRQNVTSKVMTPAQFERYRKQQEMSRTVSNTEKSQGSDDEGDHYDDDDEAERTRQLAKERRKQEAHLAVYRQQMMKVTGDQPSDLPNLGQPRPSYDRATGSMPGLRMSTLSLNLESPESSGKTSDDEDEDIPLGILAAHGFPAKNRPPAHLSKTGSTPNIRYTSETYPPPKTSVAGSVAGGSRGGLPPFARNLPQDPYYGASLVNPAVRESLAFGNASRDSVYGGPQPNLPPGGLVGVIAGEERARAMRRGSPNPSGGYSAPNTPGGGVSPMGIPPGMLPPPMASPNDQAQFEMSQQMMQMMQMQTQWIQQMMSVQGMQSGQMPPMQFSPQQQQMMQNAGVHAPSGFPMQRPLSMESHSAPVTPAVGPGHPRAMSMLDRHSGQQFIQHGNRSSMAPSLASGILPGPGQGYTPSIAPSERSNVGMPSRYRPVSIAPADEAQKVPSRASTFTSGAALQSWNDSKGSAAASVQMVPGPRSMTKLGSDDDDDEGWEEMKQKRESKKSTWKMRRSKDVHGLSDMYYPAD